MSRLFFVPAGSILVGWHLLTRTFAVVPFVLWVIALVQIALTKPAVGAVVAWIVIVTLIPLLGSILWFAIGRRSLRSDAPPQIS
ncbi:PLDc N-terminal domain-containing protein [Leifsonia sp. McL0607]|uniref:PLDc N-terminal domain-containing protein n=1 Tax=Leifsonia sp. McL0607 TaxID=3415672 RepID=UPI003CFBB22B